MSTMRPQLMPYVQTNTSTKPFAMVPPMAKKIAAQRADRMEPEGSACSVKPGPECAPVIAQRGLKLLQNIKDHLAEHYAPKDDKQQQRGWDLEAEWSKAQQALLKVKDIVDVQRVIQDFISSAGDYHVGIRYIASHASTLPFEARCKENRVIVTKVSDPSKVPFSVGDEITQWDGKPVMDVLGLLMGDLGYNVPKTDLAMAVLALTSRQGRVGIEVPQGKVELTVVAQATGKASKQTLEWDHTPDTLGYTSGGKPHEVRAAPALMPKTTPTQSVVLKSLDRQMLPHFVSPGDIQAAPGGIGDKFSEVPPLGEVLWTADETNPFHAYVFERDDGARLGYVRIPHYSGELSDLAHFAQIIAAFMQKGVQGLVVDQLNNPGGSVLYLYMLLAMMTDKPLATPLHRMMLTHEDVARAKQVLAIPPDQMLAQLGLPPELAKILDKAVNFTQLLRDHAAFVIEQKDKGNLAPKLTDPFHLGFGSTIQPLLPFGVPMMVLVNEKCFSGGDFLPAIVQDNKRGKIVGVTTAGAGGAVRKLEGMLNLLGVDLYSITWTIAERLDKTKIEGRGVKPDIELDFTVNDLRNGYADYKKGVVAATYDILPRRRLTLGGLFMPPPPQGVVQ